MAGPNNKGGKGGLGGLLKGDGDAVPDALQELATKFPSLGKDLQALEDMLDKTAKTLDKAAETDARSSSELSASNDRIAEAHRRLTDITEKLTSGQVITQKETKKLNKEMQRLTKVTAAEAKLATGGRSRFGAMKASLHSESGRKSFMRRGFGMADDDILMGHGKRGVLGRAGKAGLGQIAEHSGGGIGAGLARAGPAGLAIGALLGVITAGLKKQRDGAVAATPRALNFGTTSKGGTNAQNVSAEVTLVNKALSDARMATVAFNGDVEATQASITKLISETGAAWTEVNKVTSEGMNNVERLEQLRFIGLGTTEENTDRIIKMMNESGKSFSEALGVYEQVALEARTVAGNTGGDLKVIMGDFARSIEAVAAATESLDTSHKGLARTMKANLVVAGNLGMTYDRSVKAAQGLTNAVVNQRDEGFATIDIMEDLRIAMGSDDARVRKDAGLLMEQAAKGTDPEKIAQMFKGAGLTSDAGVSSGIMERAIKRSGGNQRLMEAELGTDLTLDQMRLIQEMQQQLQSGKSLAAVEKGLSDKDAAGFKEIRDELKKQQFSPTALASATLDQLVVALAAQFESALSRVTEVLKGIHDILKSIKEFGFGETMKEGVSGMLGLDNSDDYGLEAAQNKLTQRMLPLLGKDVSMTDTFQDRVDKLRKSGKLQDLTVLTEDERRALVELGGASAMEARVAMSRSEDTKRSKDAARTLTITGMKVTGTPTADGTVVGETRVGIEIAPGTITGATQQAQSQADSTGRHGP